METKNKISSWNFPRLFRLLFGIAVSLYALWNGDPILLLPGGLLLLQGVLNIGCCCGSTCGTTTSQSTTHYQDIIKPYRPNEKQNNP